jgi:hypothetical protein
MQVWRMTRMHQFLHVSSSSGTGLKEGCDLCTPTMWLQPYDTTKLPLCGKTGSSLASKLTRDWPFGGTVDLVAGCHRDVGKDCDAILSRVSFQQRLQRRVERK